MEEVIQKDNKGELSFSRFLSPSPFLSPPPSFPPSLFSPLFPPLHSLSLLLPLLLLFKGREDPQSAYIVYFIESGVSLHHKHIAH